MSYPCSRSGCETARHPEARAHRGAAASDHRQASHRAAGRAPRRGRRGGRSAASQRRDPPHLAGGHGERRRARVSAALPHRGGTQPRDGPQQWRGEVAHPTIEDAVRGMPVVAASASLTGIIRRRGLLKYLIPDFLQRTKSGEFRPPTRSQLQRGSADPRLIAVEEVMARSVLCLSEEQTLADVANLISSKDVDRFPVVREGVVVGFLTRADLIRRLIAP